MFKILLQQIALIICICSIKCTDKIKSVTLQDLLAYNRWMKDYSKTFFNSDEKIYRQLIFLQNLKKINENNRISNLGYVQGVNQFSDMNEEEFEKLVLNINLLDQEAHYQENLPKSPPQLSSQPSSNSTQIELPKSIDWRTSNKVSPVKDQGFCGACWAFSAIGLLESVNLIKEQELVDCTYTGSAKYINYACNGGMPYRAHNYIKDIGIASQQNYPYKGALGSCKKSRYQRAYFAPGEHYFVENISGNKTNDIKQALQKSPLSVQVDARNWFSYQSGVLSNCEKKLTHSALLVGYTQEGFWIIKNSFGTNWGMQGYIYLAPGDTCGIETTVMGTSF